MNLEVDVGPNITSMLEQLARQIGVTVDTVFPWYVRQQVLEGWMFFAVLAALLLIFVPLFIVSVCKANFDKENVYVPLCVVSGLVLTACLVVGSLGSVGAATQIANPEFAAMRALTTDIARMKR